MVLSPLLGFFLSYLFIKIINNSFSAPHKTIFRYLQITSASSIGFMHGLNDAQKTMGVITLCLSIALASGQIPPSLQWLTQNATYTTVPSWVKIICALTMALGTALGGWKIIKTMGFRIVKLTTREGFVAESASASTILICSLFGMPVSTTHNITASILGAGTGSHPEKVSYRIVYKILLAWVMTLPCAAAFGALFAALLS
jgi:PiT family inorganic phosphate transporter